MKNYHWFYINEYPSTECLLWIWYGESKSNPQEKEGWLWLSCNLPNEKSLISKKHIDDF
ncbi:hypothetical protein [Nostoc linckia]|uniref:hypothetical protein n=1 Tax=Nostoc linckia TaxID=92942 RepID=UPI0015D4DCC1|nr:hypothetical protein [Nostoc linckia]